MSFQACTSIWHTSCFITDRRPVRQPGTKAGSGNRYTRLHYNKSVIGEVFRHFTNREAIARASMRLSCEKEILADTFSPQMSHEQIFRHATCQGEYCLQILQDNRGKGSIRPGPVTPDVVRSSVKTAILKSTRNKLNELGSVMSFCLILATSKTGAQNLDNLYFSPAPLDDIRHTDTRVIGSDNPDDNIQSNTATHDNSASPTDSLMLMSSREKFLASVKETELSEGPYARSLTQQYLSLGNLFRIEGNTDQALEYYAKAEHKSRVNFGLYAPEQYLPIKRSIDIYLALHDYEQALERQEYLVYLHKANYGRDAAEVVPEMVVLGNMYFDAYERSINYQASPPDVTLAFGRETDYRNPEDLSNFEKSFQFLNLARKQYIDSITTLIAL